MAKKKLKIGWQKYEDLLEKQMSSPLLKMMTDKLSEELMGDENEDEASNVEEESEEYHQPLIFPFSAQFLEDVTMTANFECWMAHTNFDLTNKIKEMLDRIDGIEILKICSRYRFFVGIGKMFNFADVRQNIEKVLFKENIDDKE
jgi:hypothetical protein